MCPTHAYQVMIVWKMGKLPVVPPDLIMTGGPLRKIVPIIHCPVASLITDEVGVEFSYCG
jgi:hypothetical protein